MDPAFPAHARRSGLRVGFISPVARLEPNALSGSPYRVLTHLSRRVELVPLLPPDLDSPATSARSLPARILRKARARLLTFDGQVRALEHAYPALVRHATLARAAALSGSIDAQLAHHRLDALLGCFVTWPLFGLRSPLPLVYYTDATTRIINSTYPAFIYRSRGFKEACDRIEGAVLRRAHRAAFASRYALDSAVNDYGVPRARATIIPMGANVTPGSAAEIDPAPPPPPHTGGQLRLCIVAADPVRKRLDLAIDTAEELSRLGWDARLLYIGPPTPRSIASARVTNIGRLRLSDERDRATHRRVLAASHLLMLPSVAEAFGIAPAEAAHFGRPSIVSAVGGLPTVVQHGRTGLVMPQGAGCREYAHAIAGLCADAERYRAMSAAALDRARDTLSWDRCADRLVELLESAAARRAAA